MAANDAVKKKRGKAPAPKLGKADWIAAGLELLGEQGIASVAVEPLCARLGVTKGSFYWHFADRNALHRELLEAWRQDSTMRVMREASLAGAPAAQLERLFKAVASTPNARRETAIRAWAQVDVDVAAAVTASDRTRIGYVKGLLEELGHSSERAELLARISFLTMIGGFLASSYGHDLPTPKLWKAVLEILSLPPGADRRK